ncbi:hypothetical protein [Hymenobacter negativus]|uniref:Uncharacterized protein n=1 Tax=Hymenobacter negativus TaxID=2795026 RepID=A0ABS0Q2E6_9BACT|nr:hypothetical protein [Hymenobacter negativus]MBH8556518.1 hypothetical protein [Hymenobacter negativus]
MGDTTAFQAEVQAWLHGILTSEKPLDGISAYRFGLGEVEEGYVLYLAGSKIYNEEHDEWAANLPEFLAAKELIISGDDGREWYWILLDVIYVLGRALRKMLVQSSFLGGTIPVYTGFESGDLYRIK